MRKYLFLAAAAAAAIASPAAAHDGSMYAGFEFGLWGPSDTSIDVDTVYPASTVPGRPTGAHSYDDGADVHYRRGWDGDILGGYDFGRFRVEGELGYKHVDIRDVEFTAPLLNDINGALVLNPALNNDAIEIGGHSNVLSGMINGLVDFGDDAGWRGYFGVGIGMASAGGVTAAAVAVVNALGDVRDASGSIIAGARDANGRFLDGARLVSEGGVQGRFADTALQNTTIAVVATSAYLARVELSQLAQASSAALYRRITPTGTSFDGDVIFAIGPLEGPTAPAPQVEGLAVAALEQAVERAVRLAVGRDGIPGLADGIDGR